MNQKIFDVALSGVREDITSSARRIGLTAPPAGGVLGSYMKEQLLRGADRMLARASDVMLNRRRGDSFNIIDVGFLKAALESAAYYERNMSDARLFDSHTDLLSHALSLSHTLRQPGKTL